MAAEYNSAYSPETMNASYKKNTQIGNENSSSLHINYNVDIMYSIVGGTEPPTLPLRQELRTQGVELVYNARGVGQTVVCKEQKRRETQLLEKLKKIETKIESKKSYRRTQKREQALGMVRDLRQKLEHSASGISYEMYLDELRRLRDLKNATMDASRDAKTTSASTDDEDGRAPASDDKCINNDGTVNTVHIENQLMHALDILNDSGSDFQLSDGESLDYTNDNSDESLLSDGTVATAPITDTSMETTLGDVNMDERESASSPLQGEEIDGLRDARGDSSDTENSDKGFHSSRWQNLAIDGGASISGHTARTTASGTTVLASNTTGGHLKIQGSEDSSNSLPVVKSPSSSSVRFKDVKPSTEDNLARARALIESARIIQRSFSSDSNCSSIKPSDSYKQAQMELDEGYAPETGRYHLIVSHACPLSHRTLVVRALKGLQDAISASFVDCSWDPQLVWDPSVVSNPDNDVSFWSIADSKDDSSNVSEDDIFRVFQSTYLNKEDDAIRVPVLWDKTKKKVVSNTSAEIMRMLNFDFNKWARRPKLNLYPVGNKKESDDIDQWVHDAILVGVYRCGLAESQHQYDEAIDNLTEALDKVDRIVRKRGFLTGSKLTGSDVRLFVVLLRLDEIYRIIFKVNTRRIATMPGLLEYVRDIYHVKGMKDVCDIAAMKKEYFGARAQGEFIIPCGGTFMKLLEAEPLAP